MIYNTLIRDMSSEEYHGMGGTFSSSQLKTILEDPQVFHKKYITKEIERLDIPAFAVGTYFHTAILEPEKLFVECAVYEEGMRSGKKWDAFQEANKGKAIITLSEKTTCDRMIEMVKGSPVAMSFINGSEKEVSVFAKLYVVGNEIYTIKKGEIKQLGSGGWMPADPDIDEDFLDFKAVPLIVKVRADAIGVEKGYILDLKSTTGNTKDKHEVQNKVAALSYELSAAFYLDIFSLSSENEYTDFIWTFASKDKDMPNCTNYKASYRNIMVGRAQWKKAICEIAFYTKTKWTFPDLLGEIDCAHYKLAWLSEI